MTAKPILIRTVCRSTAAEETDTLELKPGVNVIVGEKSTGKSGWLRTISYLLGETHTVEESLKPEVAEKFVSATLQGSVGEEEFTLQRRWREPNIKTTIFLNGEAIRQDDFSAVFLAKLNIPSVRFPKGNPYSGATWPHLRDCSISLIWPCFSSAACT